MGYRCENCKKEFPIAAWIETNTSTYAVPSIAPQVATTPPSRIKKPCCPHCSSIEIEEVK